MAELSPNLIKILDSKLALKLSKDKMSATISIKPLKWPPLKSSEIIEYIKFKNIKAEINKEKVKEALANRETAVVVATGKPTIDGKDGSFRLLFEKPDSRLKPKMLESGNVDYRELNMFVPVSKGMPLAQIFPEEQGIPGFTVEGEEIAAKKVEPPDIKCGENTAINPKDNTVCATVDGIVEFADKILSVKDTVRINQDVDYSIGNINVPCNLYISGKVHEGFTVTSAGNITITEDVNNAFINCGGNLKIQKGVNNNNTGKIKVNGNLDCKFLHSANVEVKGNIHVTREVLFSNIVCQKDIVVMGEEGIIIGGQIICEGNLTANEIGSKMEAATTKLTLGNVDEIISKLAIVEEEIKATESALVKSLQEVKGIQEYLESGGVSSQEFAEFENLFDKFLNEANDHKAKKEDLLKYKEELREMIKNKKIGEIQVKGIIYPGVKIRIKDSSILTRYEEKRIAFYYNSKKEKIDTKLI